MNNLTFAIIKPDAVKNNHTGKIYDRIISSGFKILGAKLIRMSISQAQGFYRIHEDKLSPLFLMVITFCCFLEEQVIFFALQFLYFDFPGY